MKKIPKAFFEESTGSNIYYIPSKAEADGDALPTQRIPVAAYARVSTQLDKQQSSYATQIGEA